MFIYVYVDFYCSSALVINVSLFSCISYDKNYLLVAGKDHQRGQTELQNGAPIPPQVKREIVTWTCITDSDWQCWKAIS